MGLSGSKTKTTNDPSAFSKPYIQQGAGALQSAYGQVSPVASGIGANLAAQLPGLSAKAFGSDPGIAAATGYNNDVLGGKYLGQGNPYLGQQIAATNDDVTNRVNSQFGAAGRTGSGANTYSLAHALANNETGLLSGEYDQERQRQAAAAGLAPGLNQAQYTGLGAYLQAAQGAVGIPQGAASTYAGGVGGLLGGYNTQTQQQSQGLGSILGGIAGAGLSGWASGGFGR